ncbi:MAG: DUF2157 domain-containing protein [Flavobacteriales bacterium]|nr:DUF2157 domain-containing protein [Flavobacteriales bacterium]
MSSVNTEELLREGIISAVQRDQIDAYYQRKKSEKINYSGILGVLGTLVVGLGVILIFAHNWDNLSHVNRMIVSLLPLSFGAFTAWLVLPKTHSPQWKRDGSILALILGVGSTLALISQTYHLQGNAWELFLCWFWLCVPLLLIKESKVVLLALVVLFQCCLFSDWGRIFNSQSVQLALITAMFLVLVFRYLFEISELRTERYKGLLDWTAALLGLSYWIFLICRYGDDTVNCLFLLSILPTGFLLLDFLWRRQSKLRRRPFAIIAFGLFSLFAGASCFEWVWTDLMGHHNQMGEYVLVSVVALIVFLIWTKKSNGKMNVILLTIAWLFIGWFSPNGYVAVLLSTLSVLVFGVFEIIRGYRNSDLKATNAGLFWILLLVCMHFFNENISFVARGVGFLVVGLVFFFLNYQLIRRQKQLKNE